MVTFEIWVPLFDTLRVHVVPSNSFAGQLGFICPHLVVAFLVRNKKVKQMLVILHVSWETAGTHDLGVSYSLNANEERLIPSLPRLRIL